MNPLVLRHRRLLLASACLGAFPFLFASPVHPQQSVTAPTTNKDTCKDVCVEKEIENFTHVIGADGDRLQISIMAEDITWANDYRRVAADVIEKQFPNNFTATDNGFGPLNLYISGTSAVSNGAQYVNVRLQVFSDTLFLPENIKGVSDFHLAKLGDPIRSMSGWLVFSEDGVLLPPIEQGMQFELWHQLNIEQVRKTITNVLSEFEANWKKVGKK